MKIQVANLGVLKQAEFELGELTIICGGNNTGKTYATYALFGFLWTWREHIVIEIPARYIDQLLADGVVHLDLAEYRRKFPKILDSGCTAYAKQLSAIFAAPAERFQESEFSITLEAENRDSSGQTFWDNPEFLELGEYEYRFISIRDIGLAKRPTYIPSPSGLHDTPERVLKLNAPQYPTFRRLIGRH